MCIIGWPCWPQQRNSQHGRSGPWLLAKTALFEGLPRAHDTSSKSPTGTQGCWDRSPGRGIPAKSPGGPKGSHASKRDPKHVSQRTRKRGAQIDLLPLFYRSKPECGIISCSADGPKEKDPCLYEPLPFSWPTCFPSSNLQESRGAQTCGVLARSCWAGCCWTFCLKHS